MDMLNLSIPLIKSNCKDNYFFMHYPFFYGEFNKTSREIEKNDLVRPNSKRVMEIIYNSYLNPYDFESEMVFEALKKSSIIEYSLGLHLPKSKEDINNGVIIDHEPPLIVENIHEYKKSLIKKIYEENPETVFIPFGYSTGIQSISQLIKNPYFIGRYGEKNAESFIELHSTYEEDPCIYSYKQVNELLLNKFVIKEDFGLLNIYSKSLTMDGSRFKNNDKGYGIGISY